jgi:acetyltransferase
MLDKLFTPESVAVIGASRTPGKVGYDIVGNLKESGFAGAIIPVNPVGGELLGLQVYKKLADYPDPVDLVIIVLPAGLVIQAAKDAVRKKAGAVVVISAGFREVGEEGHRLEQELADIVTSAGARLLGPNCLGLINTANNLNASFAGKMPEPGSIAVFSQSGALCTAMLDMAAGRHLGLSKLVSIGNKADLSEVDMLKNLARDE